MIIEGADRDNNVKRTGVHWTVSHWNAGDWGTGKGTRQRVCEADAQVAFSDFLSNVDWLLEYSAGGHGTGCDSQRAKSWLVLDRLEKDYLPVPTLLNLGGGICFTSVGSTPSTPLSLFGRNSIFPLGKVSISLIDELLCKVRDTAAGEYV